MFSTLPLAAAIFTHTATIENFAPFASRRAGLVFDELELTVDLEGTATSSLLEQARFRFRFLAEH